MSLLEHRTAGDWISEVTFRICEAGEWQHLTSNEIFDQRAVVLFALPGAFTPTCSSSHLPGYATHADYIKNQGIDEIYCLSVNDWFVTDAWRSHLAIGSRVTMLPDGNADFTRGMGMLVNKRHPGFGERSWRYSMVVRNRVIEAIFVEDFSDPGDPFAVSGASRMLKHLKRRAEAAE